MRTEILISLLAFLAIVLFCLWIYLYSRSRQERKDVIKRIEQAGIEQIKDDQETKILYVIREFFLRIFGPLGKVLKPKKEGELSYLRAMFLKAGYRSENAPVIFFGLKVFLSLLFLAASFLARMLIWKTMLPLHFMLISIILVMVGLYLPNLWLKMKISQRREKVREGLPDALDLMVVCVEAGTGLDAAINRVGEEMRMNNKVLSEEFKLLSLELRAGMQRKDALRNLAMRTDLEDISNLVTLLIQTERFGTSIAQALRVHSDAMRTRRFQRAEEIAQKLPIKLLFPLLFFIFPTLLVVILAPAVVSIYRVLIKGGQ